MITVYISIGNSDDKLSQAEWAAYAATVGGLMRRVEGIYGGRLHGEWASLPYSSYQNACWCIEVAEEEAESIRRTLATHAAMFRQDSIAWAAVASTEFLTGPASDG